MCALFLKTSNNVSFKIFCIPTQYYPKRSLPYITPTISCIASSCGVLYFIGNGIYILNPDYYLHERDAEISVMKKYLHAYDKPLNLKNEKSFKISTMERVKQVQAISLKSLTAQ